MQNIAAITSVSSEGTTCLNWPFWVLLHKPPQVKYMLTLWLSISLSSETTGIFGTNDKNLFHEHQDFLKKTFKSLRVFVLKKKKKSYISESYTDGL